MKELLNEYEMDELASQMKGYENAKEDSCVTHDYASDYGWTLIIEAETERHYFYKEIY